MMNAPTGAASFSNNNGIGSSGGGGSDVKNGNKQHALPPPLPGTTRHVLPPESELRLEVPHGATASLTLRSHSGSAEIFGVELPPERTVRLSGTKTAAFTWHGCALDVGNEDALDIAYVSEETDPNVAYVNTHAQLEAMRDEAVSNSAAKGADGADGGTKDDRCDPSSSDSCDDSTYGPRVLLAGPADCGKTSLARVLTAYAVKLGRTPLFVDLDATDNALSVPGTLSACPMNADAVLVASAEFGGGFGSYVGGGTGGAPSGAGGGSATAATTPLVLWYGSTDLLAHPDLYAAQIDKLGSVVRSRLRNDDDARASGIVVNASGWIDEGGYDHLLRAIDAFRINVVLVVGHDRLYSMLGTHFKKKTKAATEAAEAETAAVAEGKDGDDKPGRATNESKGSSSAPSEAAWKLPRLIKLPRSGGVVSRDAAFRRGSRSRCVRRYFYGDPLQVSGAAGKASDGGAAAVGRGGAAAAGAGGAPGAAAPEAGVANRFTPCLLELPFDTLRLFRMSSVSLAASMLPISGKQTTDPVQLQRIEELSPQLKHAVLAVCHPSAVEAYEKSGNARDLYSAAVAGFVAVEKADVDRDVLSLLSPCAGSLPSSTLLVGDVSWLE